MAGEPTPDPVIARRSRRIASLPVGRGHRNGLKREGGERERKTLREERQRGIRRVDEEEETERAVREDGDRS